MNGGGGEAGGGGVVRDDFRLFYFIAISFLPDFLNVANLSFYLSFSYRAVLSSRSEKNISTDTTHSYI